MIFRTFIFCSLVYIITCNCNYKGVIYSSGDSWVIDSCNICTCKSDGTFFCETNNCTAVQCYDNGKGYNLGETYLASDGCNECVCTVHGAVCTLMPCGGVGVGDTHIPRCYYHGRVYTVGDAFQAIDGCNRCICTERGEAFCSKMFCQPSTLQPPETTTTSTVTTTTTPSTSTSTPKCTYNGKVHSVGDAFKSSDGCNTCNCVSNEVVACTLMACIPTTTEMPPTTSLLKCAYNGRTYSVGDSFKADDGCNTCNCMADGQVACTKMYCPTTTIIAQTLATAILQCNYNMHVYSVGESFTAQDGCNTCRCTGPEQVACTKMLCPSTTIIIETTVLPTTTSENGTSAQTPTCIYNGKEYAFGISFKADDGCNTCHCARKDLVDCTLMLCPPTTSQTEISVPQIATKSSQRCQYNGQEFMVGETFRSVDGCNTCRCGDSGIVACTKMICPTSTAMESSTAIRTCNYMGKEYPFGVTFKSNDGCNNCQCMGQEVACTLKLCPPTTMQSVITN